MIYYCGQPVDIIYSNAYHVCFISAGDCHHVYLPDLRDNYGKKIPDYATLPFADPKKLLERVYHGPYSHYTKLNTITIISLTNSKDKIVQRLAKMYRTKLIS
jgi:hypothetical protein